MLEKYYTINEAAGISIHARNDGVLDISACSIRVENNQLSFDKKVISVTSAEKMQQHLPPKTAIALNLTGKGILQKQVAKIDEVNQNNFGKILPNANWDDFYIQNFISGESSFVSIIRKAEADKWIDQLTKLGYVPLTLSLGPFPVQNIISQLNVYGEEIVFDGHSIQRDEQLNWVSYRYNESAKSPFAIKAETELINEKLLSPYAAAFQLVLAGKLSPVVADVPSLENNFKKRVEDKKFKVYGFLILAVFFALLLINFLLFSWLNGFNAKLTGQVSRSAQSTSDVQKVNQDIGQKEALLKTLGWEGAINKSALIDQVASLLPGELTWKQAEIDPVDLTATRLQKSIVFYTRKFRIIGNSDKIIPVNEWIARLKSKPWVKNVQLDSYTYSSELNTGQFIVIIDY